MIDDKGKNKSESKVITPEVIEPEKLIRNAIRTILSPEATQEVVTQSFDSLREVILSEEKVIEITKEVIESEKSLSLEDKKNTTQYLDKLMEMFKNEPSEKYKDLIWQEIIVVRKQVEESNRNRREFVSNETKKIQENGRALNSQIVVGIITLTAIFLGVGVAYFTKDKV